MSKDYKNTLNLPKTDFPMKANLAKREPELLAFWEERGIYQKIQEKNRDAEPFILHDGPPYANGHIHMGHALNKVLKDIIVKYRSMKGYYTPYVPGWDCHGLPIEHQVDKKLGSKKHSTPLIEKRKLCRDYASRFIDIQREEFKRLGVLGDWQNPYITMSYEYEASIARAFLDILKRGYVYKGKKPVHWCPTCVTALAEAEVEYAEKVSPSIYVRFRVLREYAEGISSGDDVYFVIWTTTPWTLPANLALAVHPDVKYVAVKKEDGVYIVADPLRQRLSEEISLNGEVIREFKGAELRGIRAAHPFVDRESVVVTGDFVTTEDGTGVVHIAPGHGEDDYLIGLEHDLEIYAPVDDRGRFTTDALGLKGEFVFKANELIIEKLRELGALLGASEIKHSYPHCWRCKRPVIFRATEQWFISVEKDDLRKKCLDEIDRVQWVPRWGRERIYSMMTGRPDWCISRQRAWGVPITIISCESCGEPVVDDGVFQRIVDSFKSRGADAWFEVPLEEYLGEGYTCKSCGSGQFKKEQDILDVWFDSGVSHIAVCKEDKRLKWPAEMYLEGSDQHRGWFQSSLITSVALMQRAPYDTVLTHGFVVDGKGKKMSKSLGNVISPEDIIKQNGAEILRLWASAEDYRDDIRLSKEILSRLIEAYRKIRNTCRFLLGNIHDFDHRDYSESLLEIDRWAMSRLQDLIRKVTRAYENYDFHEVFHRIYNFCIVDMSSFYLDILKDRLYTFRADSPERRAAQWTIKEILITITKLMAPVLSFTSEEIWQFMSFTDEESVFLSNFPVVREEFVDLELEKRWQGLIDVRDLVNKALEEKRAQKVIGNSLEAKVVLYAQGERAQLLNQYRDFLPALFIVSSVELSQYSERPEDALTSEEISDLAVVVQRAEGKKCQRCWNWSETVGSFDDEPEVCSRCYQVLKAG